MFQQYGLIIACIFSVAFCQTQNPPVGGSLDDLIGSVFDANAPNTDPGIISANPSNGGVLQPNAGTLQPGNGNFPQSGSGGSLSSGGGALPGVLPGIIPGGDVVLGGVGNNLQIGENIPLNGGNSFPSSENTLTNGVNVLPGGGKNPNRPNGNNGAVNNIGGGATQNQVNPCGFGECVPYYQCANGTIITDGEGLLDIRIGEDSEVHPCKGLFETCCNLKSDVPLIPDTQINEGCGFRNAEGVGFRITGAKDNEAQFGEFPWMVAILREERALDKILHVFQCGGSLIHPSVVLTAAHCISGKEPTSLKIRAGEWDTQTKDEIFPHQDRDVAEYVIHEHYYKGGLFNDIALLFLSKPVELAENVNTACMPPPDFSFDRSKCFVSGWGKDLFGREGKYQVILKRVELPVVPRARCQDELRKTRLGKHFELHNSFICAGGERGKDTCKGDGGSPLVCPIQGTLNRFYQAGIVAWGIGCGGDTPGVYVNVPLFRKWIDEQCRAKGIDSSSYIFVTGL